MNVTIEVHSEAPDLNRTFDQVRKSSKGSAAGYSATSEWLTCPEKSRLRQVGIKLKADAQEDGIDARDLGTLIHELLRIRVWYGHDCASQQLERWRSEIGESYTKAALMLGTYEQTFPYQAEALKYVGVEADVVSNIRMGPADPRPCFRTVRYDGLVYANDAAGQRPQLYSLERKTMSRGGSTALTPYHGQGMVQVAVWNANETLVAKYGRMAGVIFESLIKTKVPRVDRTPHYFSPAQEALALEYLRYSANGQATFQPLPDGTMPKMLHACWGRFSPCDFISLCHEGVIGDYQRHGRTLFDHRDLLNDDRFAAAEANLDVPW